MDFLGKGEREVVKRAELSLTPMVDVVFLLLIFFMVGMKFKEIDRKLEADLPKASQEPTETVLTNEIWIFVKVREGSTLKNPQPKIVIDQLTMRNWKQVKHRLHQLSKIQGAKQDPVIVAPSQNAQHGWVMKVLDYLHQLKFSNINFKE